MTGEPPTTSPPAAPPSGEEAGFGLHRHIARAVLLLGLLGIVVMFAATPIQSPLHTWFDIESLKSTSQFCIALGTGGSVVKPIDLNKLIVDLVRGGK